MEFEGKLERLGRILGAYGKAAIAFSGGVDSSFLCAAARRELGDGALAITVVSPFLPASELRDAKVIAESIGIRHVLLEVPDIGDTVAANPSDRCYHCKRSHFAAIRDAACAHGISAVLDGSNVDDEGDYRPGMKALAELGIASPLREAGLSKAEIRESSRRLGLPTADMPAYACLASRIPYGERIDARKLARIEKAEDYLRSLGLSQVRVRSHGDLARIEVAPEERKKFFSEALLDEIAARLSSFGFLYSSIDLAGYRTGSLNASILKTGELAMKRDRILYFDCFSGLSGDMTLAGLVGLGLPEDYLRAELSKLGLPGWKLRFSPGSKHGIRGLRADVDLEPEGDGRHRILLRQGRPHGHRSHADIKRLLEDAPIAEGARQRSLAIFRRLAEAEGRVHGMEADKVEFHEVGAVDSIIDIVGAAIGLDYLAPDRILCSRIELGGGFVKCQHGVLPVPAPAVVELLRGIPVKSGAVPFETTTPTGAAILAASVDEFTDDLPFTVREVAYGIGHRDMDIPNALRLYLGEGRAAATASAPVTAAASAAGASATESRAMQAGMVLECNIDDMSPELHGYLFERLLGAGAQDVWLTPIHMKKSRPAVTVSVLCSAEDEAKLIDLLISETSTFGLRRYRVEKLPLPRETSEVETSLGKVRVKTAFIDGRPAKWKPEFEDLRAIAVNTGMPLREVQQSVLAEIGAALGGKP